MWAIIDIKLNVLYYGTMSECLSFLEKQMNKALKMVPAYKDKETGEVDFWDGTIYQ